MKKALSIILQLLGILFLLCLAIMTYAVFSPPKEKTDFTRKDVAFVFNWSGLNEEKYVEVLQGYESVWLWMDDYSQRFCIQTAGLTPKTSEYKTWVKGADTDPIMLKIRNNATDMADIGACFPNINNGNNETLYSYIKGARISRDEIYGFEIIFYDPESKRLLFYGHQL